MPDQIPEKRPWRRKSWNYLIYPRFQLTIIAVNTIVTLAIFIAVWIQASRAFGKLEEMGQAIKLAPDHPYFQFIDFQSRHMYANLSVAFAIGLVISGIVTLLLSHRLAGPIIRTRGYFREITANGKIEYKLKFRDGDFFSDLPAIVNEALSTLAKKE
jgi:hypothetical protein